MSGNFVSIKKRREISISLIVLSFFTSVLYSYFLSFTERGLPLTDWFNMAVNGIWFFVLAWVASKVYRGELSAKGILLFLTYLVGLLTGFDLFEENGSFLLAGISTLQALLLLGAYYVIRNGIELDNAGA